jgi:hypothetical protein
LNNKDRNATNVISAGVSNKPSLIKPLRTTFHYQNPENPTELASKASQWHTF